MKLLWSLQTTGDPVIQFVADLISQERVWDVFIAVFVGAVVAIGVDAYRSRKELFCEVIYDWPSVMSSVAYVSRDFGLEISRRMYDFIHDAGGAPEDLVVLNVRNTGFVTIEPGDFLTPVECDFGSEADVERGEVLGTKPPDMNAAVRVEDSRKVLIDIDFLSRGDTVLVIVERSSPYTDAQVQARIVGTNLRVTRSPRRPRDIVAQPPTAKYWIFLVAPILHFVVSPILDSCSYTVLALIVDYSALLLTSAFFYLLYREWRIRGRVTFP